MITGRDKFADAADASAKICQAVDVAIERLTAQFQGRVINGLGIHRDPGQARSAVDAAMGQLMLAAGIIAATAWPTDADYDRLDNPGDE